MKLWAKATSVFDRILDGLMVASTVILAFITLAVCAEVCVRYILDLSIIWVPEISEISLLYITFLIIAWLQKREEHVTVDIVLNRLRPRVRTFFQIIFSIIGAIVFLILVWYGGQVTWQHFERGLYIPSALNIPNAYVLVIIPIGSLLFFIQCLRQTNKYLGELGGPPKQE